jgi:hypothetical protein
MFDEDRGTIEDGVTVPELNQYDDFAKSGIKTNEFGSIAKTGLSEQMANVNYNKYGVYLDLDTAQLYTNGAVGNKNWREIFEALPGQYAADVSRIYLTNLDNDNTVTGTFTISPFDEGKILINWDADSFPTDSIISGRTSIDYIIDPTRFNPDSIKVAGLRLLLLENIGDENATKVPLAWQNTDGSGLIAKANDVVEWDGTKWNIVFDASKENSLTYTTNLNTNIQYRFKDGEWFKSVDGDYPVGTWRIDLAG